MKLLRYIFFIFLILIMTGCALSVKRAPGSVPKPAVKTLGRVEFTVPFVRQGADREDQFALWLENPETGSHFKTLTVTAYTATTGFKTNPGILPVWEQRSGIAGMTGAQQKDVNAMLVATPETGILTYIWYGDNDAGTEAMPAGIYHYFLESTVKKQDHVIYHGVITLGKQPNKSEGIKEAVTGVQNKLVSGIQAEFKPDTQK